MTIYLDKFATKGSFNTPFKISYANTAEYSFIKKLFLKIGELADSWISVSSVKIELKVAPYFVRNLDEKDSVLGAGTIAWTAVTHQRSSMKNVILKIVKIASFSLIPLSLPALIAKFAYNFLYVRPFVNSLSESNFTLGYAIVTSKSSVDDMQKWLLNHLPEPQKEKFKTLFNQTFLELTQLPNDAISTQRDRIVCRLTDINYTKNLLRAMTIENNDYLQFEISRGTIQDAWRSSLNKPEMFADLTVMTFDSFNCLVRVLEEPATPADKRAEIMGKLKNVRLYPTLEASFVGTKYSIPYIEVHA